MQPSTAVTSPLTLSWAAFITVIAESNFRYTHVPYVKPEDRVSITPLSQTFSQIVVNFGYMESPNIPKVLLICREQGWHFEVMQTSFFLSRRTLKVANDSSLPQWQDRLFVALTTFSDDAARYFSLPTDRVVEIGTQVTV